MKKRMKHLNRLLKDALRSLLRPGLNTAVASTRRPMSDERASILDMSGPKLIVEPDDGEKPVMDFLNSAQKTVALKQFTFTHPLLLDTVMALHKRGVRVRVMLNGAKATGERLNDPFFEKMKSTGIEVQWSNPSFLVTHEKSIIVDGKSALLATFNFMEKYFQATRDYGILTDDRTQVAQVQKCFDCDWEREPFHPHEDAGLAWSPEHARHLVCNFIDRAHKTLDVQHPKFAEPVILERVLAAIERGVRVRILCGGKHGLHQPDLMYSFALWRLMHKAGAKVHKQKNLRAHAKLVVVDRKWALLGTQNFDQPAFDLRREVAMKVYDAAVVRDLATMFERDWETSRKYEPPYPIEKPAEEEENEFPHDAALMHD
jgi:phosphatidylserine/phosphatidylglycerophosphate/cardiolipin synthase-like enzyme